MEFHDELYAIEDDYWWFKSKRAVLIKILKKLIKNSNSRSYLLDAGCGTGAILKETERFMTGIGVEKYFEAIKFCKQRGLNKLVTAELEYLPFRNNKFDVVLVIDILEHVNDDFKVLKELHRVTKNGCSLIIHVPAYMFFWSDHDVAVGHKRRYTTRNLVKLLEKINFKVKIIQHRLCMFFLLGFARKIYIKFRKLLTKDQSIKSYRPRVGKLINTILYTLVKFEDSILDFIPMPFGLSILCVVQKE